MKKALTVLNLLPRFVLNELVQTEKDYVKDLGIVVEVSGWCRVRLCSPRQEQIGCYPGMGALAWWFCVFYSVRVFAEMKIMMM
jgi:hypothetical protein